MKAVILVGGQGTRLKSITGDIPKPMVQLAGKSLLEHQFDVLKDNGINEVILLVGYKSDEIERYYGNGDSFGMTISYIYEEVPLGTGGALKPLESLIEDEFLLLCGDIIFDINLEKFLHFHLSSNSKLTLLVHPNDHPYDSDLVEVDRMGKVTKLLTKPHEESLVYRNLVNAGIKIVSKDIFKYIAQNKKSDFMHDVVKSMLDDDVTVYAYNTPEYIKDAGTPERLKSVERDILSGKVKALNLRNKRKAVFFDRDGTLNYNMDSNICYEDFRLFDDVSEAIIALNKTDYLVVVITNQPMIAKGFITFDETEEIHKKMETILGHQNAKIDRIYYCPHHPDKGFDGEVVELKIECDCRKPNIGMIRKAAQDLNIDVKNSYFVGDSKADILTAKNAGMKSILLDRENILSSLDSDFRVESLSQLSGIIE